MTLDSRFVHHSHTLKILLDTVGLFLVLVSEEKEDVEESMGDEGGLCFHRPCVVSEPLRFEGEIFSMGTSEKRVF